MASPDDPHGALRRFAARHQLSPLAARELAELFEAERRGEVWGASPSSTTLNHAATLPTLAPARPMAPDAEADQRTRLVPFADRYEDRGVIGLGGMGEVRRVYDRMLQRMLAVKVLRWENIDNADARTRFLAEAQVNAQLQHPGVVAVHDQGELPDGRPWFTMKEVRGRTLGDAIQSRFRQADDAPTARRLIEVFGRICRTVAYAHAKTVVHRDIKPANIMLGEFGEVLVMDWGIARVGSDPPSARSPSSAPDPVSAPVRRSASLSGGTRAGRVMGTPAYMAPEQARGDHARVGPASDVYALGAVLFHILAGQPPYRGNASAVLSQVLAGPPPPIDEVRPLALGPAPPDLVALSERAMARDPTARPTVDALAVEVEGWLDGVRKTAQAWAIVAEADAMVPRIAELRSAVSALRQRAGSILDPLPDHAPVDEKRPGWTLEDQARDAASEAELTEVRMLQTLRSALHVVPDLPEAHSRLAAYYQRRLIGAEAQRDAHTARLYEEMVRTHDRGALTEWLAGDGRVTLLTDPSGARVTAWRYEERDRRLVEVPCGELGRTPLREVPIARGSHMLVVEADGCQPVRYPIDIGRGTHWDGIPPDDSEAYVIRLPKVGELGSDDVYVPAGWCIVGGDDDAVDSLSRRRVWLDGFVIRRFPVTNAEYIAFLDDMVATAGAALAARHVPRQTHSAGGDEPHHICTLGPDGRYVLGTDLYGWHWEGNWPVVHIDWHDSMAFARWLGQQSGQPWRPCHGLEHEKAARGVDGRRLPWGEHFEQTWANVLNSRAGPPTIRPVGSTDSDISPYGLLDAVGNVRSWCCNTYKRDGDTAAGCRLRAQVATETTTREIRGGCWHSSPYLGRIAGRFGAEPSQRYSVLGLRLGRPFT